MHFNRKRCKKISIFPKTNIKEDMVVTAGQIRPQKSQKTL